MVALRTVETDGRRSEPFDALESGDRSELQEFARVHLEFATWHPHYTFESIDVAVHRDGASAARCHVAARSRQLGRIECGATGSSDLEAIRHVASMLESEVNLRIAAAEPVRPRRVVRRVPVRRRGMSPSAVRPSADVVPAQWSTP